MNRETIASALFALVEPIMRAAGAVTVSRRLLHWSDVATPDQPAVFLAQGNETPQQSGAGEPTIWRLSYEFYLYVREEDPSIAPATKLNLLLDALEGALAPKGSATKQKLGGLVEHCWISGTVETDEGTLGNQTMAVVPVEILYTS